MRRQAKRGPTAPQLPQDRRASLQDFNGVRPIILTVES
jgi:hypothetical protein